MEKMYTKSRFKVGRWQDNTLRVAAAVIIKSQSTTEEVTLVVNTKSGSNKKNDNT